VELASPLKTKKPGVCLQFHSFGQLVGHSASKGTGGTGKKQADCGPDAPSPTLHAAPVSVQPTLAAGGRLIGTKRSRRLAAGDGAQSEEDATANLDEIAMLGPHPWRISFSFGRALQVRVAALQTKGGRHENAEAAQRALPERASARSHVLRRALSIRT
jgi:fructose-bisphosphate aldolase class I